MQLREVDFFLSRTWCSTWQWNDLPVALIAKTKSISTVGANGHANGPPRGFWVAGSATGDAATVETGLATPNFAPWPQRCSGHFLTPNSWQSQTCSSQQWKTMFSAEFRVCRKPGAKIGLAWSREPEWLRWGGGVAGTCDGHSIWHRPSPRWRARCSQRVEML